MNIAVTGATGYIGNRLLRAARQAGYPVLALSRRAVAQPGVAWRAYDLADAGPLVLPADITTIIHLAADTASAAVAPEVEAHAARRLIDAARAIGADVVFVSSQTARDDAPTQYGRTKWCIERMVLEAGGWIVRPGQVYGGPAQGLFGVLCQQVHRLPVLPAFLPAPAVQPVHVDDLVQALLRYRQAPPASLLCIADPIGIGFTDFLRAIARGRTARSPLAVPVPTALVNAAAGLLGPARASRLGLGRLRSLFALPAMDTVADLQCLSLTLRPLHAGMSRSGLARRERLREGRALLSYILRDTPPPSLVRRYARAVEALRPPDAVPLLPVWALRRPARLAWLDGISGSDAAWAAELSWRLDAALMLAEATPQGARRFLGLGRPAGPCRSTLRIAWAIGADLLRRISQVALRPWLSRAVRRKAGT